METQDQEIRTTIRDEVSNFLREVFGADLGGSALLGEFAGLIHRRVVAVHAGPVEVTPAPEVVETETQASIPVSMMPEPSEAPFIPQPAPLSGPKPPEMTIDEAGTVPDFISQPPEVFIPTDAPVATLPSEPPLEIA